MYRSTSSDENDPTTGPAIFARSPLGRGGDADADSGEDKPGKSGSESENSVGEIILSRNEYLPINPRYMLRMPARYWTEDKSSVGPRQ